MKHLIEEARQFHAATGAAVYDGTPPGDELKDLRAKLMLEEVDEYQKGKREGDVEEQVDGAGDTLYLLAGDCVAYGWTTNMPIMASHWEAMDLYGAYQLYLKYGRAYLEDLAAAAVQSILELEYHPRKVVDEIANSNMSKLLHDDRDELDTARAYDAIGVTVCYQGNCPVRAAISATDQTGTDGKHYPAGKVLKSVRWRKPDFSECRL